MAWVTPEDILKRWVGGDAPSAASPVLIEIIADAEDEVLRHYPLIQTRINDSELPLRRVQRVVSDVVMRAYKMAGDYRVSFSEATGPFSHSASYGSETPRTVRLTAEEIEMLAPSDDDSGVYMLSMAPGWTRGKHEHIDGEGWAW